MLKFRYLILLLVFAFANNLGAFEPKVTYLKAPLPMFNTTSEKLAQIEKNNPNDPILLEMKKISIENIKNLPDELDFGTLLIDERKKPAEIKRYHIYNFIFEGLEVQAGLAVYETLDSISVFPAIEKIGDYVSQITFKWEEPDPETGIFKHYKKTIYIKANVVEKHSASTPINNEIKEIWYAQTGKSNYEDNGNYNDNNYHIQGGGTLILPDTYKIDESK